MPLSAGNKGRVPHCPDFLWRLVALIHSMRLSLMKCAHADLSSTAWQEIGVKPSFWLEWGTTTRRPFFSLRGSRGICSFFLVVNATHTGTSLTRSDSLSFRFYRLLQRLFRKGLQHRIDQRSQPKRHIAAERDCLTLNIHSAIAL